MIYENRLQSVGITITVNKTRFKSQLAAHFSDSCQETSDGRNTLLVFNDGFQKLLLDAMANRDIESEAISMTKLVKTIRKDMLDWAEYEFNGKFPPGCQEMSVPASLKALVAMLLNGCNVQNQETVLSQPCLTIAQLIFFNMKNRPSQGATERHVKHRQPPLPLFVGLNVHTETRSRKKVNTLYSLGISVSYQCVIDLENSLATTVCKHFEDEGLVCPPILRKGLFTVGAMDNIDHNPSSTSAQGSFHGTGISVFQFPTSSKAGLCRDQLVFDKAHVEHKMHSLPDKYIMIPAVVCKSVELSVPEIKISGVPVDFEATKEENRWIEHAIQLMQKDELQKSDSISWAAYFASRQPETTDPAALISLLPLFNEKAATFAMIKHGMDIQRQITAHLNPGQIPVTAFDQPLFALAKYVQWQFPDIYGEQHYVVMFGGLHIEMALWNTIGELLEDSGWTNALCEAAVANPGTADSFLKASHLSRTRHCHQITSLALSKLQKDAWQLRVDMANETYISFEMWKETMIKKSPTFHFWNIVMKFEMLVLMFIRAHRIRDFALYVYALDPLAPWFFSSDRTNYSRWIPIHICDMKSLPASIKEDFSKFWVLPKTKNKFSCMPLDQGHEQNNEIVKGSGGAVGLTENLDAFRRWMVAGPEQARLLLDFEAQYLEKETSVGKNQHHEQSLSCQKTFKTQVTSLSDTILQKWETLF